MTTPLTRDLLSKIAKLSPPRRADAMAQIATAEWDRCAEDVLYWLDESKHDGIPYVYTLDPKPLYLCKQCGDDATHTFNKREAHLELRHQMKIENEAEVRVLFEELPTKRAFTLKDYMRPLIDVWLRHQLLAVEKSRDMMATWLFVTLYAWDTFFHKGRENVFQSETAPKTRELVERAHFIWYNQPKFLKKYPIREGQGTNRSGFLRVDEINSKIWGFAQGDDQIRQFHPTGVFLDEAAYQNLAGDGFAAVKPAIQSGGRFTMISSANPSWFHFVCRDRLDELGA